MSGHRGRFKPPYKEWGTVFTAKVKVLGEGGLAAGLVQNVLTKTTAVFGCPDREKIITALLGDRAKEKIITALLGDRAPSLLGDRAPSAGNVPTKGFIPDQGMLEQPYDPPIGPRPMRAPSWRLFRKLS